MINCLICQFHWWNRLSKDLVFPKSHLLVQANRHFWSSIIPTHRCSFDLYSISTDWLIHTKYDILPFHSFVWNYFWRYYFRWHFFRWNFLEPNFICIVRSLAQVNSVWNWFNDANLDKIERVREADIMVSFLTKFPVL